jgi:hypothetical protein
MRLILRYLPRCLFANTLLAIQACMALSLLATVSLAENVRFPLLAQASEPLPLPAAPAENQEGLPPECSAIVDPPLSALSTDIQPRNNEGQIVSSENLPADCAQAQKVFADKRYLAIDLACDSCRPRWCDVLGFAHFCHHPLYFEEVCLERCGVCSCCCQPTASAACFFGGALLMPVRAVCVCPCSCVPAQYGCH